MVTSNPWASGRAAAVGFIASGAFRRWKAEVNGKAGRETVTERAKADGIVDDSGLAAVGISGSLDVRMVEQGQLNAIVHVP